VRISRISSLTIKPVLAGSTALPLLFGHPWLHVEIGRSSRDTAIWTMISTPVRLAHEKARNSRPPSLAIHSLLLLLLSPPPRRKVARTVKKGHDQDPVVFHFVQQPILEHEELAKRWIVQLAHDAPAL